jgi:hypothetical protein
VIRFRNAHCTVTAHSHVLDRKSDQPSAMSLNSVVAPRLAGVCPAGAWPAGACPAGACPAGCCLDGAGGIRSRLSAATLTAYDSASTPITAAGSVTATRTPASDGPMIVVTDRASPYSAFAFAS